MTPQRMAEIHAASFTVPRPWSEGEMRELLGDSLILAEVSEDRGFALLRVLPPEAELLTIAVDPAARRQGVARDLLASAMARVRALGVEVILLEVSEANHAALYLYQGLGFRLAGRRAGYYQDGATRRDALIYRCDLTKAA